MGITYADNRFRAARVGDLANNIAEMQMNIKGLANDMSTTNNRAYEMLEALAKRAGYPTVKEYVDQAIGRLSEEDRKKYALIRGEVVDRNDRVTKAQDISGIIVAIAMSAGLAPAAISGLCRFTGWAMNYVIIGEGMAELIEGTAAGADLIAVAVDSLEATLEGAEAGGEVLEISTVVGADGVSLAATGVEGAEIGITMIRAVKIASTVLVVLAIMAEIGIVIYEAIEGHEQKIKLQENTLSLGSRRFLVKKAQLNVRVSQTWMSNTAAIIMLDDMAQSSIGDGTMTKAQKDVMITGKLQGMIGEFTASHKKITTQIIMNDLSELDKLSGVAWTEEDPTIGQIWAWIKDHPDTKKT